MTKPLPLADHPLALPDILAQCSELEGAGLFAFVARFEAETFPPCLIEHRALNALHPMLGEAATSISSANVPTPGVTTGMTAGIKNREMLLATLKHWEEPPGSFLLKKRRVYIDAIALVPRDISTPTIRGVLWCYKVGRMSKGVFASDYFVIDADWPLAEYERLFPQFTQRMATAKALQFSQRETLDYLNQPADKRVDCTHVVLGENLYDDGAAAKP